MRSDTVPKNRFNIPDPTAYTPSDSFTKTKSAAFGFGSDKRKSIADLSA